MCRATEVPVELGQYIPYHQIILQSKISQVDNSYIQFQIPPIVFIEYVWSNLINIDLSFDIS